MLISDRWFGFLFCEHKHWQRYLGDEQGQIGSGVGGPRAHWTNPSGNGIINWAPPYASARPGNDDDDASSAAAAASSGFHLWQLGAACSWPSR